MADIPLSCKHCGATTKVSEYVDLESIACPQCKEAIPIPGKKKAPEPESKLTLKGSDAVVKKPVASAIEPDAKVVDKMRSDFEQRYAEKSAFSEFVEKGGLRSIAAALIVGGPLIVLLFVGEKVDQVGAYWGVLTRWLYLAVYLCAVIFSYRKKMSVAIMLVALPCVSTVMAILDTYELMLILYKLVTDLLIVYCAITFVPWKWFQGACTGLIAAILINGIVISDSSVVGTLEKHYVSYPESMKQALVMQWEKLSKPKKT